MNTRRIFCNSFFFFSWYFQHVYNIFSPEILIFVHDFSRNSAGFLTKWSNFTKFNQLPEIFHFSKLQNYKVRREVNVSRTYPEEISKKKKIRRFFILGKLQKRNLATSGRAEFRDARTTRSVRYEGRAGGSSSLLVLMKIHGISLTQLVFRVREPVVVHRPWFAARFNLQTERRNGVCRVYQMVVLVRCLLANVSTHDGQMCLLLRVLLSAYTRSRSDSSRTTIRFPHFYSLHFALLFPLFFYPPSSSSSPFLFFSPRREKRPRIHHFRM